MAPAQIGNGNRPVRLEGGGPALFAHLGHVNGSSD